MRYQKVDLLITMCDAFSCSVKGRKDFTVTLSQCK